MRDIHPAYPDASISCACGNVVKTRSTRGDFTVDVCGACHPFYTGKQKLMDTAGRVDRFRKKFGTTAVASDRAKGGATDAVKAPAKKAGKAEKKEEAVKFSEAKVEAPKPE